MKTPRVICDLYARVSTTEQAEEGYSLGEQERKLRAYADAQGWEVHAVYLDPGYSGGGLDRPGIQAVMADAQAGRINKVVTYKLDRLSRSQKDIMYLIEDVFLANKVDYVSMTESLDTGTPFGMAMIGILAVFAQLEREQIKERTAVGRLAAAKLGRWHGGGTVPMGYIYEQKTADSPGRLVVNESEARMVRRVFELFGQGHTIRGTRMQILKEFPEHDTGINNSFVTRMLENRVYIGYLTFNDEWYKGDHEPILDEATFWRVNGIYREYISRYGNGERRPREKGFLFTGFMWCGTCGQRFRHLRNRKKHPDGTEYIYESYTCSSKCGYHPKGVTGGSCGQPQIGAEKLESAVWDQLEALQYDDLAPREDDRAERLAELERQLAATEEKAARLVDLYALGSIDLETVTRRAEETAKQRDALRARIDALRDEDTGPDYEAMRTALGRIKDIRANGSLAEQRDLMRVLIDRVVIGPGKNVVTIHWKF